MIIISVIAQIIRQLYTVIVIIAIWELGTVFLEENLGIRPMTLLPP